MTPELSTLERVSARIAARFGPGAVSGADHGSVTADVPPRRWPEALIFARNELGCDCLDWLSAVDEFPDGFAVVAHIRSARGGPHLLLRTRVAGDPPHLPTAARVYDGAAGHERETARLFGIRFDGHPGRPPPTLLPEERPPR